MAIKYASEEWVKAAREAINKNPAYQEAAKKWEGDMYFIVEPEGGLKEKIFMYFDLWHGECRAASVVTDESAKTPCLPLLGSSRGVASNIGKKGGRCPGHDDRQAQP